jgi:hypothetical protein
MTRDQTTVFLDHIRENATRYFKGFESSRIDVQFEKKQERPASILYKFSISSEAQSRGVLVKVPLYRGQQGNELSGLAFTKPDLFPKTESKDTHKLGYSALMSINKYFSSLGDENLGTVRVLDYLPEYQAIITETCKDPNLRKLFLKTNRFHPEIPAHELTLPFRNVGKWLNLYHEMSKKENVETRNEFRHEYIEAINTLTNFLGTILGDSAYFQKITSALQTSAHRILPESLPLGLGHGDFALRNILVGLDARITVLDTFAKWRAPIYEDIGYFLNSLKISAPQVISQGLVFSATQLAKYESAFLEGYFGQKPIPYPEIRLYEMLALLDKWSSVVAHSHQRWGKFKNFSTLKSLLTNRYLKRSANDFLKEIAEFASSD